MDALIHRESAAFVLDAATLIDLWHRRTALSELETCQIYKMV